MHSTTLCCVWQYADKPVEARPQVVRTYVTHRGSSAVPWIYLGPPFFIRMHWDLGFAWVPLDSLGLISTDLGFSCYNCNHLAPFGLVGITWTRLHSLGLMWFHFASSGFSRMHVNGDNGPSATVTVQS